MTESCLEDKFLAYSDDLQRLNAHTLHSSWRPLSDKNYLPYVGNGRIGLATEDGAAKVHVFGGQRHLSLAVPLSPLVDLVAEDPASASLAEEKAERATLVHYTRGLVHSVKCAEVGYGGAPVSISRQVYAHRAYPAVLVQELKVVNPTADPVSLRVERLGILDWKDVHTAPKT